MVYGRYDDREQNRDSRRGRGEFEGRRFEERHMDPSRERQDRWDRELDDSRGSHQRRGRQSSQSFGYGDDYSEGRNHSGPYDTLSERESSRGFSPLGGSAGMAVPGGSHDWGHSWHQDDYDTSYGYGGTQRGYSQRQGNSALDRVNYGLRGGADFSSSHRDRQWRNDHDRGRGEGVWESVKSFFGKGPKGWKRSDERIREDVCESLARHPAIDASDMDVTVKDGIVTLKGTVESRFIKRRTEDVIDDVSGVEDIRNELQVKRMPDLGASPGTPRP
jgi:hypothetical protein